MNILEHRIKHINSGSIAKEVGIEPGDVLLSVNNQSIEDVFDYRYLTVDDDIELLIRKKNNEEWVFDIEKSYDEKLGLEFENELMSGYKVCNNDCIFCFVSQMPEGMRDTLYFKDDDYRLSFLQGNFITLTNLKPHDVERIIKYRLEPLNISVQTMNKELRCNMLNNKFAGESLQMIDDLMSAALTMNAQIVLCKNHNDREELIYSIEALEKYLPYLKSLTIVPVGLSKYRGELTQFEAFTKEDALEVIELVEKYQNRTYPKYGFYYIQASDEWYAMAGKKVPESKRYDGFTQLENGVGMLRLLYEEVLQTLDEIKSVDNQVVGNRRLTIATGVMAYPYINDLVTVAGLITGTDLIHQLQDKELGEKLIIPINMLRTGEMVFLDDMTVEDLEKALGQKIVVVESDGSSFVNEILYDKYKVPRNNEEVAYINAYAHY
jgi:putative radical SAM enzyme (TIGR03279 family)